MVSLINVPIFLFIYIYFMVVPQLSCCLDFKIFPLNVLQTYAHFNKSSVAFQVPRNFSLGIGRFEVSVTPGDPQDSFKILITRLECNNEQEPVPLLCDRIYASEGVSGIVFYDNASKDQCFRLERLANFHQVSANYSVLVSFTPMEPTIKANELSNFELANGSNKTFTYDFEDYLPEVILIAFKTILSKEIDIQFKQNFGMCVQSKSKTFTEQSWLCNLINPSKEIVFSVHNNGDSGTYEVMVKKIKPQEMIPDIEKTVSSSIPGFGNIFYVDLTDIGILKIQVKSPDEEISLVDGNTLRSVLGGIRQYPIKAKPSNTKYENGTATAFILSKFSTSRWYYFVPETKNQHYLIKSNFIKQMDLVVNSQAIYYIDPEIYEYQPVKIIIDIKDYLERYEVVLSAQQPNSSMNLYYDANILDTQSPIFPSQNYFRKQASETLVKGSEVSLSFIVGSYDSAAYLTIHASQKGYYKLKVRKATPTSSIQVLFIFTCVSFVLFYLLSCLMKVVKSSKIREFNEFSDSVIIEEGSDMAVANNVALQINPQQPQMIQEEHNNGCDSGKILDILKKLEKQKEIEKLNQLENTTDHKAFEININTTYVKSGDEEEKCYICYEGRRTVKFEPCNHVCACAFCALIIIQTSSKCPLCREKIVEVQVKNKVGEELKG